MTVVILVKPPNQWLAFQLADSGKDQLGAHPQVQADQASQSIRVGVPPAEAYFIVHLDIGGDLHSLPDINSKILGLGRAPTVIKRVRRAKRPMGFRPGPIAAWASRSLRVSEMARQTESGSLRERRCGRRERLFRPSPSSWRKRCRPFRTHRSEQSSLWATSVTVYPARQI
ncbi:MAG: hypothetical protein RMK30_10480 [Anaerolineae bacterium]|nr:hypothetical protein [Anaerolineae bacterium]